MLATLNDYDTPLSTRTQRANAANADIYVSIHYNAGKWIAWSLSNK